LGAFAFELLLGEEPVVELVSRSAAARLKDLVGAFTDLLVGNDGVFWRGRVWSNWRFLSGAQWMFGVSFLHSLLWFHCRFVLESGY